LTIENGILRCTGVSPYAYTNKLSRHDVTFKLQGHNLPWSRRQSPKILRLEELPWTRKCELSNGKQLTASMEKYNAASPIIVKLHGPNFEARRFRDKTRSLLQDKYERQNKVYQ
jgi:hypothetical protein